MPRLTRLLVLAALLLLLLPVTGAVSQVGGDIMVPAGDIVDEDLTVFGGTVQIRGTINGDLTVMAGDVTVSGIVNGNASLMAGSITVSGTVADRLEAFGGQVTLTDHAVVEGPLELGAGRAVIDGTVKGPVTVASDTILLGPTARIGQEFAYSGVLDRDPAAQINGTVTSRLVTGISPSVGYMDTGLLLWLRSSVWLLSLIAYLVLGGFLVYLFPAFARDVSTTLADSPVRTTAYGVTLVIGIPFMLLLFLVTILGIPVAVLGGIGYVIGLWISSLYARIAAGYWLLSRFDRDDIWAALVTGVGLFAVLAMLPVIGPIVSGVAVIVGVGAVFRTLLSAYTAYRQEKELP